MQAATIATLAIALYATHQTNGLIPATATFSDCRPIYLLYGAVLCLLCGAILFSWYIPYGSAAFQQSWATLTVFCTQWLAAIIGAAAPGYSVHAALAYVDKLHNSAYKLHNLWTHQSAQLAALTEQKHQVEMQLSRVQSELYAIVQTQDTDNLEWQKLSDQYQSAAASKDAEIGVLRNQCETLSQRLEQVQAQHTEAVQQISQLHSQALTQHQQQLAIIVEVPTPVAAVQDDQRVCALEQELYAAQREMTARDQRIYQLVDEVDAGRAELDRLQSKLAANQLMLNTWQEQLQQWQHGTGTMHSAVEVNDSAGMDRTVIGALDSRPYHPSRQSSYDTGIIPRQSRRIGRAPLLSHFPSFDTLQHDLLGMLEQAMPAVQPRPRSNTYHHSYQSATMPHTMGRALPMHVNDTSNHIDAQRIITHKLRMHT